MAMKAYLEDDTRPVDRGRAPRRRLRLPIAGSKSTGGEIETLVHNISPTGLLVESDFLLSIGETFEVNLPHAGMISAKVIWTSGRLSGCQFDIPVSAATLSAAQLRSAVQPDASAAAPDTDGEPLAETFGARLLRLRSAQGLTQAQVARKLGVSEPSISAWEQDKARPKAGRLDVLAGLLGVETSVLHGLDAPNTLQDAVAKAREEIAAAAGTHPANVRIRIDM